MEENPTYSAFHSLYDDIADVDAGNMPLLAHYTSTTVLESILKNEEIWLSNPLFTNDHEEIRFVVVEGQARVSASAEIKDAFKNAEVYEAFANSFFHFFRQFADNEALDYYILCFCRHDRDNLDGKLSMWRGYGANASGACLVFDPTAIPEIENSPLMFQKVTYASASERLAWIEGLISKFCRIVRETPCTVETAHQAAYFLLDRLKLASLFSKHKGFIEEDEWRLAYIPNRDDGSRYHEMKSYWLGPRGLEPKLKLKIRKLPELPADSLLLENIIDRIILGPTSSSPISKNMIHRMLEVLGREALKEKVHSSSIPYRSLP